MWYVVTVGCLDIFTRWYYLHSVILHVMPHSNLVVLHVFAAFIYNNIVFLYYASCLTHSCLVKRKTSLVDFSLFAAIKSEFNRRWSYADPSSYLNHIMNTETIDIESNSQSLIYIELTMWPIYLAKPETRLMPASMLCKRRRITWC